MEGMLMLAALGGCSNHEEKAGKSPYPTEWNLDDLYSSEQSPEFLAAQHHFLAAAQAFADQYQGHITLENLADALSAYEAFVLQWIRLETYVSLKHQVHLNDARVSALYQKFAEQGAKASALTVFFPVECLNLPYKDLQERMKKNSRLAHFRVWIENLFRNRDHVLSTSEEKVLAKTRVIQGPSWTKFYDEFLSRVDFDLGGTPCKLEFVLHQMADGKTDRKRREAAAALSNGLASHAFIFTRVYNNILLDHYIEDELRRYEKPESQRLVADAIAPEIVNAMIAAVKRHYPNLSHRYYRLKARLLKQKKLQYWDRSITVHLHEVHELTYPEAVQQVLGIYGGFSPTFEKIARQFVTKGWVDVFPREGKASGAFACPSSVDTHPYVLLNFMGTQRDLLTMAHEFGHGVHQYLSRGVGQLSADPALALSETASTFAEKLTYSHLIAKASTGKEKIQLMLCGELDDFMNTVVRQTAFFEFEKKAHDKRKEGEVQTEDFHAIWRQTQVDALGDGVEIDPCVDNFWMYISHFFASPFYVYSYVFGRLFVEALYSAHEKDPQTFRGKYEAFLSSGGTVLCEEAAQRFGFDLRSPVFWDDVLKRIERQIEALEKLCEKEGV